MSDQPHPSVLVVDDSSVMRTMIARGLVGAGVSGDALRFAANGRLALEAIRADPPGLVVSDVNMPEMTGAELLEVLAAEGQLERMPVVIITSISSSRELLGLVRNGAAAVIRKPVDQPSLIAELRPFVQALMDATPAPAPEVAEGESVVDLDAVLERAFVNVLARVTHVTESMLDDLRQNRLQLSATHVTVLCDAVDFCREALALVVSDGSDAPLAARANALSDVLRAAAEARPVAANVEAARPAAPITIDLDDEPEPAATSTPAPLAPVIPLAPVVPLAPPAAAPHLAAAPGPEPDATVEPTDEPKPEGEERRPADDAGRKTIRVDVDKLDALINLVGELILAENMVAHDEAIAGMQIDSFQKAVMHLNRVTRGLHDIVMAVRMVPIEGLFRKMHRVVRDVSMRLGKDVELVVEGEGTEVDKNLIEHIGDPLMHIMRNALDHGIESPADRVAAGKPANGTVRLEARHNGGEVWISVTDDGKGLDRDRILAKAAERGLVDLEQAMGWPDTRVFQLVFQAGFSTAAAVTEVSGRGVGLDVVLRNIQFLKGKVDITSTPGAGTTFTLRIPLTLAIIEGMLVDVAGARYIVPMLAIRELIKLRPGLVHTLPDGREVAQLREQFVALVRLSELHGLGQQRRTMEGTLVIVEHDGIQMALLVDKLLGQRQTVIKPLPDYLGELPGISGCSILSNGDITLILELADLVRNHVGTTHGAGAHPVAA